MGELIPAHGGYRNLKSFQLARLVYDITVRFCDRYIQKRSRTNDQMVQAARSGVQNIAEASQASGTSKKTELKLTNVARASLEELRLDYEDFLRQRDLSHWPPNHPALQRFKALRCKTIEEFRNWIEEERRHGRSRTDTDGHRAGRERPCPSVPGSAELAANGALSLLNITCWLLDQQLRKLEKTFLEQGGFTERLYRSRRRNR